MLKQWEAVTVVPLWRSVDRCVGIIWWNLDADRSGDIHANEAQLWLTRPASSHTIHNQLLFFLPFTLHLSQCTVHFFPSLCCIRVRSLLISISIICFYPAFLFLLSQRSQVACNQISWSPFPSCQYSPNTTYFHTQSCTHSHTSSNLCILKRWILNRILYHICKAWK